MSEWLRQRFFSPQQALNEPMTCWSIAVIVALLGLT